MKIPNFYATTLKYDIDAVTSTIGVTTLPKDENGDVITAGIMVLEARSTDRHEIIEYTSVDGTDLKGCVRGLGGTTASTHKKNSIIEANATGLHLTRLYDAFDNFNATENGGWLPLLAPPTVSLTKGNNFYDISFVGDLTNILAKDQRLRLPRTVTPGTQSADFNGTSQYAGKVTPVGITFTDDWTAEAWVWLDTYGSISNIIGRRSSGTVGWGFRIGGTGSVEMFGCGSAAADVLSSNIGIPLGQWVHVAASMDISAGTGKTYINGIEVSSTYTNGASTSVTQGGDLVIGRENYSTNNYLDGRVSDARLWNVVRTQAQIQNNMNQQLVGNETNLIAYWKLSGNWNDSTTNGNNLTATGAVANYAANPFNTIEYARIITKPVFSGGFTTMTVWTGKYCTIPNQVLGSTYYALYGSVVGMPEDLKKASIYIRNDAAVKLNATNASGLQTAYIIRDGDTLYFSFQNLTTAVAVTDAELNMGTIDLPSFGISPSLAGRTFLVAFADGGNQLIEMWLYDSGNFSTVDLQPGTSMAAGNAITGTFIARIE